MTRPDTPDPTRLDDLLADAAVFGLTPDERAELDALLAADPSADPAAFERLAADVARTLADDAPPLPPELAARIAAAAGAFLPAIPVPDEQPATAAVPVSPGVSPAPPAEVRPRRVREFAGWAAAAACLVAAVGVWRSTRPAAVPTPAESREILLASATPDVLRLDWTATKDPAAAGATGDVVWSTSAQRGYMRFRGLEPNDPARTQYQLWIFDAGRDDRYPVDGGVFDVPPDGGEVVVPVRPAVRVGSPVLFAITVEKPGGVVVSTRERLPLLAKVTP